MNDWKMSANDTFENHNHISQGPVRCMYYMDQYMLDVMDFTLKMLTNILTSWIFLELMTRITHPSTARGPFH